MDERLQNLEAWIQQAIKEIQDVKIQLNDTRSEMRANFDDLRGHISRNDQTDNDNTRMVENVRNIIDANRGEINNIKSTVNTLDGRLNDIRNGINDIRGKIR